MTPLSIDIACGPFSQLTVTVRYGAPVGAASPPIPLTRSSMPVCRPILYASFAFTSGSGVAPPLAIAPKALATDAIFSSCDRALAKYWQVDWPPDSFDCVRSTATPRICDASSLLSSEQASTWRPVAPVAAATVTGVERLVSCRNDAASLSILFLTRYPT